MNANKSEDLRESELYPDGATKKGKIYGSECMKCGHRLGVHFINIGTKKQTCDGYGDKPCNCKKYLNPSVQTRVASRLEVDKDG
jgi:hypothetical protein